MARFADVSNTEIEKLLQNQHSTNTKLSTNVAWRVFEAYTQANNINMDLLLVEKPILCEVLKIIKY